MQFFIATVAPVTNLTSFVVFADTFEIADSNCPDTSLNTLCNDVFCDGV